MMWIYGRRVLQSCKYSKWKKWNVHQFEFLQQNFPKEIYLHLNRPQSNQKLILNVFVQKWEAILLSLRKLEVKNWLSRRETFYLSPSRMWLAQEEPHGEFYHQFKRKKTIRVTQKMLTRWKTISSSLKQNWLASVRTFLHSLKTT